MNLRHLAVFNAVAITGGINRAAERLMISQPAVSRQVQALEHALGVTLLERRPRGIRLTEAGEILADYARRLFEIEAQANEVFADLRSLRTGVLRLGGSMSLGNYFLPEVIAAFHHQYPEIRISLEVGNTYYILDMVRHNRVDIGFIEGDFDANEFNADLFMHDELIVIAHPGHPLAGQGPMPFSRLCQHGCVMREAGSGTRAALNNLLKHAGISDHPFNLTLGSPEAVKRTVQRGAGLAVASNLTVVNELESGALVHIPLSGPSAYRKLHRITLPHKQLAPAASPFLALTDDYAKRYGAIPEVA
jgi:DNA-binding transcriptional LysR family regulator